MAVSGVNNGDIGRMSMSDFKAMDANPKSNETKKFMQRAMQFFTSKSLQRQGSLGKLHAPPRNANSKA
jgi:hypothetical protein